MKSLFKILCLSAIFVSISTWASAEAAHAHGLGGLDASKTTSKVTGITPPTDAFNVEIVENGENLIFSRMQDNDIIILGIDSEPYLLFNTKGVFENIKSPTRLINDQSTEEYSPETIRRVFAETSNDPNTEPKWDKVSNSESYKIHDHRAHYMGDVPEGISNLGVSQIEVLVDSQIHIVEFQLIAGDSNNPFVYILIWLVFSASIFALVKFLPNIAKRLFNKTTIAVLGLAVALIQVAHIYGYINFTYEDTISSLGQSAYAFLVIALFLSIAYMALRNRNMSTRIFWNKHSPLLCISGITGLIAGSAIEFASLIQPYPASTLGVPIIRLMILTTTVVSTLFLIIGIMNIKPNHTSEQTLEQQDSSS